MSGYQILVFSGKWTLLVASNSFISCKIFIHSDVFSCSGMELVNLNFNRF